MAECNFDFDFDDHSSEKTNTVPKNHRAINKENMKQLPTDRSADRSTGPISLINYLISEVINFGRM